MRMKIALAAAAALLAGQAASPVALAKPDAPRRQANQCFYTRNVTSFAAPDDKTLYVRVGVRDVYRFDMFGPCPDIDWNQRLALVSRGSSWICDGMDAEVITHATGLGHQRCPVRSVRKLTPEEVAALPRHARP
jgi:hypothetical protein